MKAVTQDLKGPKSESLQPTQSKQIEKKKHLVSHRNLPNSYSSLLGKKKKTQQQQKTNSLLYFKPGYFISENNALR